MSTAIDPRPAAGALSRVTVAVRPPLGAGGLSSRGGLSRPGQIARPGPLGPGLSRFHPAFTEYVATPINVAYTPTGGVTLAGTADHAMIRIAALLGGGLTFAGAATIQKLKLGAVSGGLVFAGTAPIVKIKLGATSGQLTFAGSGTLSHDHTAAVSGGLLLAGSAPIEKLKLGAVSGGLLLASSAPVLKLKFPPTSGVVLFAGTAATSLNETFTYQPTGGLSFAGAAATQGPAGTIVAVVTTTFIPTWRPRRCR